MSTNVTVETHDDGTLYVPVTDAIADRLGIQAGDEMTISTARGALLFLPMNTAADLKIAA